MMVTCKVTGCPFYNAANFCSKPTVVNIDENGMCGEIWRKGVQKQNIPPVMKREVINVLEADIKNESDKTLDEKEGAGT